MDVQIVNTRFNEVRNSLVFTIQYRSPYSGNLINSDIEIQEHERIVQTGTSFDLMVKALERVSAHFHKIRPEELEPSAMMEQVDSALGAARAQIALDKALLISE